MMIAMNQMLSLDEVPSADDGDDEYDHRDEIAKPV